jgi:hypothetical protein
MFVNRDECLPARLQRLDIGAAARRWQGARRRWRRAAPAIIQEVKRRAAA